MLSDSLFERGNFVMRRQLSKVQFEAIEKLRTGALTILQRRELLREAAEKGWADVLQSSIGE